MCITVCLVSRMELSFVFSIDQQDFLFLSFFLFFFLKVYQYLRHWNSLRDFPVLLSSTSLNGCECICISEHRGNTNYCGFLLLHRYRFGGKHADKWPCTGSRSNYFTDTAGQLWLLGDFGTGTAAALSQQHRSRSGQRRKCPAVLIKHGFYVMLNKNGTKLVTQLVRTHKHRHWSGRKQAELLQ